MALAALVVVTTVLVGMVVWLTPWNVYPGFDVPVSVGKYFTPSQIARSEAFHDDAKWPAWLGLVANVAFAVAVGFTSVGKRLVARVRQLVTPWWLQMLALVLGVLLIQLFVTLPFALWSSQVSRSYGLSTQSWAGWAADLLKSLGLSIVLTSLGLLLLLALARRFASTWFAPAAALAALLVLGLSFSYPMVIEPVFNKITPMAASPLRTDLLQLAHEDNLDGADVMVADASRRTSAYNAYVSGFGATKRIVVYDTLLASSPDSQVKLIVAHELGHAKRHDVLIGSAMGAVGAAAAVLALYLVLTREGVRRRVGATSAGDPAVVPVIIALSVLVSLAASPIESAVSRHIETRADLHSLQLTNDPTSFILLQQRLATNNLSHLQPDPVLSWWFDSHPTTLERIAMALEWERQHEPDDE